MPNRRQVLLGLGAAGVAAVVGVATVTRDQPASASSADRLVTLNYRGHTIKVLISDDMAMATIDDHSMVHLERSKLDKYYTHLLPFHEFADIKSAITNIIDRAAQRLFIL